MPFHFCMDELLAIMMLLPWVGIIFTKIHAWYHTKFGHKCHDKECHETHVIHPGLVSDPEQDCEIPITLTDEEVSDPIGWQLTDKGFVTGFVLCNEPIAEEELLAKFAEEDSSRLKAAIRASLADGNLILTNNKLEFGEL